MKISLHNRLALLIALPDYAYNSVRLLIATG